jgi:hypothetical protein
MPHFPPDFDPDFAHLPPDVPSSANADNRSYSPNDIRNEVARLGGG